jgi:hypothetical protein
MHNIHDDHLGAKEQSAMRKQKKKKSKCTLSLKLNKSTFFIHSRSNIDEHRIERVHMKKVTGELDVERGVRLALDKCDVEQCELVGGEIGTCESVLKNDAKETIESSHRCGSDLRGRGPVREEALNVGCDLGGRHLRRIVLDKATVLVKEKLLKVPLDLGHFADVLDVAVDRVEVAAVDVALAHDRKCDAKRLACECGDFLVGAGLLCAKLIARKRENLEAILAVLVLKCLKTSVLFGETTLRSN